MNLTLTLFSQDVEDFVLEIKTNSDAKFQDLHNLILQECKYSEREKQCFFICDEDWRIKTKINLEDSGDAGFDEDIYIMQNCSLGEFLDEEGQRFAYLFEPEGKKIFLLEVSEVTFGKSNKTTSISRKHGKAPTQNTVNGEEEYIPMQNPTTEETIVEEDFYGSEGFEDGELDMEGFEINE